VKLTLPTDSAERKNVPVYSGFLQYFPAAVAGAAKHSKMGNDKHNPGEELHHSRGKSGDHADCIVRHLQDIGDMLAALDRAGTCAFDPEGILAEANALVWRAAALSQELHEKFGAPLAPRAKLPDDGKQARIYNAVLDQRPDWAIAPPPAGADGLAKALHAAQVAASGPSQRDDSLRPSRPVGPTADATSPAPHEWQHQQTAKRVL
jgi:hypothetical protein